MRGNKWSQYELGQTNDVSCMGNLNKRLFIGMLNQGKIGEMYDGADIFGVDHEAVIESPDLLASSEIKRFKELHLLFNNVTLDVPVRWEVEVENNKVDIIEADIDLRGGYYSSQDYDSNFYETGQDDTGDVDYRVLHINRYGRFLSFKLSTSSFLNFRGFKLVYEPITNKEVG